MQTILVYLILLICAGFALRSFIHFLKKPASSAHPCSHCQGHCALYDLKRKNCPEDSGLSVKK